MNGYQKTEYVLNNFILPFEIVSGVLCNFTSILIWTLGPKSSRLPCCSYFTSLAVVDFLVLAFPATILYASIAYPEVYMTVLDTEFCWAEILSSYALIEISNWISTALSFERMLAIVFPFKFTSENLKKRGIVVCLIITFLFVTANVPVVFMFKERNFTQICSNEEDHEFYLYIPTVVIDAVLGTLLPFTLIIACNLVVVVAIVRRKHNVTSSARHDGQGARMLTRLVLGVGLVFVLGNGAWVAVTFIKLIWYTEEVEEIIFFTRVADTLMYFCSWANPLLCLLICKSIKEDLTHVAASMINGARKCLFMICK